MKNHSFVLTLALAVAIVAGLGFIVWHSRGSGATQSTSGQQTNSALPDLQLFAWNQFQLFIAGGERADGTYDAAWGPWSEWITRSDLRPHRLIPPQTGGGGLLRTNAFNQLIVSGLAASILENSSPDRKLTPTDCNPKVPAPCSTVLYNSKAQSHIDSAHLLDPRAVEASPTGVNGGIQPFPDDTIIVKTAWKVVEPIPNHPEIGNLVFSNPDFPGTQHFLLLFDSSQLCADGQNAPAVIDSHHSPVKQLAIQCFVSVPIRTKADAQAVSQGVGTVKPGDYVVLLGVNVVRKQQGRWIWSTIWWTPDKTSQTEFNRKPKDLQLPRWQYYRANATNSMFDPTDPSKRMICYNPYLEQTVVNQTVSNCVTCHRLAEFPTPSNALSFGSPAAGQSVEVPNDYYAGAVKTDALWTIADILGEGSHPASNQSRRRSAARF